MKGFKLKREKVMEITIRLNETEICYLFEELDTLYNADMIPVWFTTLDKFYALLQQKVKEIRDENII